MILRDYQLKVVEHILNNSKNFLYCLPTGTGKSCIIEYITNHFINHGKAVGVIVPSIELLHNLKNYFLSKARNKYLIQLMSDKNISKDKLLYLGVYKSFEKKKYLLPKLDLLIHDECHHCSSNTWNNLMDISRNIGFSATPFRFDGMPLPFDDIYEPHSINWFMENNYLCPDIIEYTGEQLIYNSKEVEDLTLQWDQAKNYVHGEFLRDWQKYNNGKTIIYATNIEHCKILEENYSTIVPAKTIHSKLSISERNKIFKEFEKGHIQVLINVNVCIEGINVPDASTIQFARYFGNIGSYVQAIGRVLRPIPNKKVIIIDNAGNLTHGSVRYLEKWESLFYEALKREREDIFTEHQEKQISPIVIPKPSKPIGSENLEKYNLTRFQDALIKSMKKKSGEQVIDYWRSYMIKYQVNSDEFTQVLNSCSRIMSESKARRLLSEYI